MLIIDKVKACFNKQKQDILTYVTINMVCWLNEGHVVKSGDYVHKAVDILDK